MINQFHCYCFEINDHVYKIKNIFGDGKQQLASRHYTLIQHNNIRLFQFPNNDFW